jgi:dihydropteroate synthase
MTAGASIWNDVSGLRADGALDLAAELGCEVVIMHMQGEPQTMQRRPSYGDVVEDVLEYLDKRTSAALAAGVRPHNILIDPGLGFGKTAEHTLRLLSALRRFTADGRRVVLGASRKRFLMTVDPSAVEPLDRLGGSIACVLEAASAGCEVVRVHDVRETAQALSLWRAVAARQSVGDENDHQEQGAGADAIEGEWV